MQVENVLVTLTLDLLELKVKPRELLKSSPTMTHSSKCSLTEILHRVILFTLEVEA